MTLGYKVTMATGDPVISLVVAWALYAMADDLHTTKSLVRKSGVYGPDALDALETTARVSAGVQAGFALAVILTKVFAFMLAGFTLTVILKKVGPRAGLVVPGDEAGRHARV